MTGARHRRRECKVVYRCPHCASGHCRRRRGCGVRNGEDEWTCDDISARRQRGVHAAGCDGGLRWGCSVAGMRTASWSASSAMFSFSTFLFCSQRRRVHGHFRMLPHPILHASSVSRPLDIVRYVIGSHFVSSPNLLAFCLIFLDRHTRLWEKFGARLLSAQQRPRWLVCLPAHSQGTFNAQLHPSGHHLLSLHLPLALSRRLCCFRKQKQRTRLLSTSPMTASQKSTLN